MAVDVNDIEQRLESDDLDSMLDAFDALSLNSGGKKKEPLDKKATEKLIPLCVDRLKHDEIGVRAGAAQVIAEQMKAENSHLTPNLSAIAKSLASPDNVDIVRGKEDRKSFTKYHRNACDIITEMQFNKPELLMPSFKPLGQYLVACTAQKNQKIATAACNYWARLLVPPVSAQLVEFWLPAVLNKLGKLIPSLVKCMVYHEEHLKFLEEQSKEDTNGEIPDELEQFTNLRNFAALGFENICRIFQSEVTIIFKPLIPKKLNSDNWLEVEAMLLAISAFTQAVGTPRDLNDLYKDLVPHMLSMYSHPEPLVRSINCFAMQQFLNTNIKGVKDPFTKMLKCTLNLLGDPNREVQEMAINSLSAILAFANRDITPFSKKIIQDLSHADSTLQGRARFTYYECIGHIFGRMGSLLSDGDASQLMIPLMNQWRTLEWNSSDQTEKNSQDTFMLCQSLCVIAAYSKTAFAPYNDEIFGKIVPYLQAVNRPSETETQHMVAYMDVLSALFEGQGKTANKMVDKYGLVDVLLGVLENNQLPDNVHQSTLALLGHLCNNDFEVIMPKLDKILDILDKELSKDVNGIKNNALWALCPVIKNYPHDDDRLMKYTKKLEAILMTQSLDQGTAINAAMALTHLGARWPDDMVPTILKDEVFSILCALMQQQFPRELEKAAIFKNLCSIVKPNARELSRDAATQLCIAAAILDVHDEELTKALKTVLRDVRSAQGGNGWSKVSQQIGNQMAYSLRKRYKLY